MTTYAFARNLVLAVSASIALATAPASRQADRDGEIERWHEDLLYLAEQLEALHPDPWFGTPQADFEEAVGTLYDEMYDLTDDEIEVEFMRLLALVSAKGRDGHSGIWPGFGQTSFLPVKLYHFEDGWFIVDAKEGMKESIGARVVRIEDTPIEEVAQLVGPLLTCDNETNRDDKRSIALVVPSILRAVGVARSDASTVRLHVEHAPGKSAVLALESEPMGSRALWTSPMSMRLPASSDAMWLENPGEAWRMRRLPEARALYVQYNQVSASNAAGQTIGAFAKEVVAEFHASSAERLVIDVRSNGGGNNTTFGPFIQALQADPDIDKKGRLFALIGRATFSAAGNFVTVIERDTNAILIGENSGGAPNLYGDAWTVSLPNSSLMVRISTRYHEFGDADDPRLTHEPHVRIALTSADYFGQRDPVLYAALDHHE
jgi:hypothetical protein